MPTATPHPRAKRGSTPRRLLLPLPEALDDAARKAAKAARLSLSEWWRQAGQAALEKGR